MMAKKKQKFMGLQEAFDDFHKNIYPHLSTDDKDSIKFQVSRYKNKGKISSDKIREMLKKYGYSN